MSMSKQEERISGMESVFSGSVLDPTTCSRLSLGEKRKLVHEIAQCSKDAPEVLRSFTRKELLEIICYEMGKERKYTGYSKFQMIEHLLKLVSQSSTESISTSFPARNQAQNKRQRNIEAPLQSLNDLDPVTNKEEHAKVRVCQNIVCKANLSLEDAFCKRCSCCICHHYDDNKDPSLWLTCGSDFGGENNSCGMSCHLECTLKQKRQVLKKDRCSTLESCFKCVYCGGVYDIMRTWKKQLLIAKEARRVDVLCLRLSLSHKILLRTAQFEEVHRKVECAVKLLNKEVGPLDQVCARMSRGIVNRLSCGAEVQKICSSAVEYFDNMSSYQQQYCKKEPTTCEIQFEQSSPTSVTIVLHYEEDNLLNEVSGCRLWHRRFDMKAYPEHPTIIVFKPEKRFDIKDLHPSTEYICKVSLISSTGILGDWEAKWVTPALRESSDATLPKQEKEDNMVIAQNHSQAESTNSSDIKLASEDHPAKLRSLDGINKKKKSKGSYLLPSLMIPSVSPLTPCKSDRMWKVPSPGCAKQLEESDYEYSVRVVKWLQIEGHLDEDFRVKFLTWFSLKATKQERRVVTVFVDTFMDDPPSLAGQLTHTFLDKICCEQKSSSRYGFCTCLQQ